MRRLDGYTTFGLVAYSLGFHLVVVMVATSFGRVAPARASAPPRPMELTEVELTPTPPSPPGAPGAPGSPAARAPSHHAAAAKAAKAAEPPPVAPPSTDKDPNAIAVPPPVASAAPPTASAASDLADAVRHAMLAPASSAPSAPGGGGGGGGGAGLGSYKGMLAGWLQARVAGGGGAADEPHELLRVTARVSLSPERAITSFSIVSPSGHAAFDARIDARLRAIVSSGATLPPPPEGIEAPPSLTVAFTCKPNERCA